MSLLSVIEIKIAIWKTQAIKLAYALDTRERFEAMTPLRSLRKIKRKARKFLTKLITSYLPPPNLCAIQIESMPMFVRTTTASLDDYVLQAYEPYCAELFRQAISPGAVVLDIGAQFGYYSLIAARRTGPNGRVYSFEPAPANFELLKKNVQINNYGNYIIPVQKAVGNTSCLLTLFLYKHSDSHGAYRHPDVAVEKTIRAECVTIDQFLKGQLVDVVKMDIEGNEPSALQGMKNTISKSKSLVLFIEFAPLFLQRAGVVPKDYLSQIIGLGFDVNIVDERQRCLIPLTDGGLMQHEGCTWYTNLSCVKKV